MVEINEISCVGEPETQFNCAEVTETHSNNEASITSL
jgi:hypothetical protein